VEPHQKLRIHSITSDYGLLRCRPVASSSTVPSSRGLTPLYSRGDFGGDDRSATAKKEEWVDLQPDGNSFDLMSGLIRRKA
jgi:biotin--protein ligase